MMDNANCNRQTSEEAEDEPCNCCPYGYHIHLDFVQFAKEMLSREADTETLAALKVQNSVLQKAKLYSSQPTVIPSLPRDREPGSEIENGLVRKRIESWESRCSSEDVLGEGLCKAIREFEEFVSSGDKDSSEACRLQSADEDASSEKVAAVESAETGCTTTTLSQEVTTEDLPIPRFPSSKMQAALKVMNDALLCGRATTQEVTSAITTISEEWFDVTGAKTAHPRDVKNYLNCFGCFSSQLLRYIVNMPDANGITALHYASSYENFEVISQLLDSNVCDPNKANKTGYTSTMLASLAKIRTNRQEDIVRRLFTLGDVNIKAAQHAQTCLMLAASHGRFETAKLLIQVGADVNLQDEDGSTALMCATEHGHVDIVQHLLTQESCDPNLTDNDGSTALKVALEAGQKDIAVLLYAHMHFQDKHTLLASPLYHSPTPGLARRTKSMNPSTPSLSSADSSSVVCIHASPLLAKRHQSSII